MRSNLSLVMIKFVAAIVLVICIRPLLVSIGMQGDESLHRDNMDAPESFDTVEQARWFRFRDEFCPGGYPNVTKGSELFSLARRLLSHNLSSFVATSQSKRHLNFFYSGFYWQNVADGMGYMSHENIKANLLYIRIWKAGTTQIGNWWGEAVLPANGTAELNSVVPNFVKRMERSGRNPRKDLCIVTAIRDPISHFLSGYNEMEYRILLANQTSQGQSPGFYGIADRELRFHRFLLDLLDLDPDVFSVPGVPHVFPMARILAGLESVNLTLTAYLPSISNLTYDWPTFVRTNCPEVQEDLVKKSGPLNFSAGQRKSSADTLGTYRGAKKAWANQGAMAEALCALHAMDYACFYPLPDGVPILCRTLYEREFFYWPNPSTPFPRDSLATTSGTDKLA